MLIKKGHQKIGYIGEKKDVQYSIDRRLGYIQALSEAGYEVKEDYIKNLSSSYSSDYSHGQARGVLTVKFSL